MSAKGNATHCHAHRIARTAPHRTAPHDLPHARAPLCRRQPCRARCGFDSCAAFQLGSTNSNGCASPRYVSLETEDACKSLAAIAGQEYDVVHDVMEACSYYPAGCFRHTVTGKFYWNPHGVGANNSFAQPLCAGAPARPALPPECVDEWYR